jgi:hypothetical protein
MDCQRGESRGFQTVEQTRTECLTLGSVVALGALIQKSDEPVSSCTGYSAEGKRLSAGRS